MPSSQNADLVLMTDSLDTWFQLPPSLLMKRYHSINQRANARSLARYGSLNRRTLAQTIVFGSEKKCWPNPPSSLACYSVPDSPLSHSLFGPRTDEVRDEEDDENPYQYVRPRWLNSGFIMGPVRDIKRVFVRAVEMAERLERDGEGKEGEVEGVVMKGEVGMTDQGVLSRVWGEQEFSREEKLVEDVAAVKDKANGKADWGDLGKWRLQMGVNYEFGIGIDYARELSATTQWSWYDAEWITICDNDTTLDAADRFEVEMPRVSGLQEDVAASALPFAALEKRLKVDGMTWQNVSLYTSLWTGIVPVSIHHNAKKDGQKRVRDKEWRRMWFAPYAKQFLDERVRAVEGKGKVFGVETMGKKGERGWISWNELCDQGMQKILFEL
ncbi:uncharacterized protein KY384_008689 [Bacidia gigantensis]|uniref:uncharacterized protein n=1 Tax=Bacidia gigantensis TaxID=2732470 RepID=UPI001D044918|nr:uncharacterized protein KY384_008689 [Bacidia gigantensis]KAG8526489.1 hypothetical protein KY384_008689 [Bacidia gigantensis]